jgi:LemA protein
MDGFLIVAAVLVVVLLLVTAAHNGLAMLRQDVRDAWGSMDAQLRRRYDLLPPLVSIARATGEPIPPALAAALTAKNQAAVAFNPHQLAEAEAALTAHLRELFARPPGPLSALPAFAPSRALLLAAQSDIDRSVRRYNEVVEAYNTALLSFPHDIVALAFGFKAQPVFPLTDGPT